MFKLLLSWIIIHLLIDWLIGLLYDGLMSFIHNRLHLNLLSLGRLPVTDVCVFVKEFISVLWGDGYNRGLNWFFKFDGGQVQARMGFSNLTEGVIKALQEGRTQLREWGVRVVIFTDDLFLSLTELAFEVLYFLVFSFQDFFHLLCPLFKILPLLLWKIKLLLHCGLLVLKLTQLILRHLCLCLNMLQGSLVVKTSSYQPFHHDHGLKRKKDG